MNISLILLLSFTIVAAANENPDDEKCLYRATVDLTYQKKLDNGSYIYQGIIIPPEEQALYTKQLHFRNKSTEVPSHLRGCVCSKGKRCIKLCCEKYEIFNVKTFKCDRISKLMKISWDLDIQLSNDTSEVMNVFQKFIYQVGLPCDQPEALIMDSDKWILLENGEVYLTHEKVFLDTVSYCLSPYQLHDDTQEYSLMAFSCPMEVKSANTLVLNTYAMTLSIVFLIPTIVVYMILKELRGNLRGKILICYLISLTMAYSVISFINHSRIQFDYIPCCILGYTCYFFFMGAFLWLSVLCYDIWSNFRENNIEVNPRADRIRFILYSLHAWGWSTIFTLLTIWADKSTTIDDDLKPGIGVELCWVNTSRWSALIYFYGPNLTILIFNLITFTYLTIHIYKVRQDSAKITHKERSFQENAIVILRLFLIMGVSWIFDIISYSLPEKDEWQYIFIISDLINALQGLLIFSLFVIKRNVMDSLKKKFNCNKPVQLSRSNMSLPTTTTTLTASTAT